MLEKVLNHLRNFCRIGVEFHDESLCDRNFAEDAKITSVIEKYRRTGLLPTRTRPAIQPDQMPMVSDFGEAMEALRAGAEAQKVEAQKAEAQKAEAQKAEAQKKEEGVNGNPEDSRASARAQASNT